MLMEKLKVRLANPSTSWIIIALSTLLAFLFLAITTFSVPFSKSLFFLRTSKARGVRFGLWGWCLEYDAICIGDPSLGYSWDPELPPSATTALVLYPMASVTLFLFMVSTIPTFRAPATQVHWKITRVLALISFSLSALAFLCMIGVFSVAQSRFKNAGFSTNLGPLVTFSVLATLLLGVVTVLTFKMEPSKVQDVRKLKEKDAESHKPSRRSKTDHNPTGPGQRTHDRVANQVK